MPVDEELQGVFEGLRGALEAVSEALDAYRVRPEDELDAYRVPAEDRLRALGAGLEDATQRYEGATGRCLDLLQERLGGEEPEAGVVVDQILTVACVDATIAVQAGLLAALREPLDPPAGAATRQLGPDEEAALGLSLRTQAGPLLDELEGNDGAQQDALGAGGGGARPPAPRAVLPTERASPVDELFDRVLTIAAGDLVTTGAHCAPFAAGLVSHLATLDVPELRGLLDTLQPGLRALRRLFARALGWIATKLRAVVDRLPRGRLPSVVDAVLSWSGGPVRVWVAARLGNALHVEEPRSAARKCLAADADPRPALRAGGEVVEHFEGRRRLVPLANRALALSAGLNLAGVPVTAALGALLVAYSVMNAHDHVDSPVLGVRMPGNPGLRQALCRRSPGAPGAT